MRDLWSTRSHPTQAEFAEAYGIGNQSAVSQFLRGDVPLSLKAARGFAAGLQCRIEDFSPRLAAEAAVIASMVPGSEPLDPDVAEAAAAINKLPPVSRKFVLMAIRNAMYLAQEGNTLQANPLTQTDEGDGQNPAGRLRKVKRL